MATLKTVADFLAALDLDRRAQVSLLRNLILAAEPGLTEHIKWNAPSYQWNGVDRITFNLQNKEGQVRLVFHMGASIPEDKGGAPVMTDPTGMLAWQSDIRALVSFRGGDDIEAKADQVKDLVALWLAVPPKPLPGTKGG